MPAAPAPAQAEPASERAASPPPLFVERRARPRDAAPARPAGPARALRWLTAVPLVALAALVAGPLVALAAAALAAFAAQSTVLTRLRRQARELDRLAHSDHLTGLGNARALWSDLDRLLAAEAAAVIFLDLDRFKRVNDAHGHAVGDAVLEVAGAAVRDTTGADGRAYRYGGEELVVLLPGAAEPQAAALAERIRARVAGLSAGLPDVTISAGVAAAGAGAHGHQLLDRADAALRRAKATGRDRIVCATSLPDEPGLEDEPTLTARRAALAIAAATLEARDPDTGSHCDDVVVLCEAIGDRLGIAGADRDHLLAAARLHDVGKVAIPESILAKPGPLDDDEWRVMRRHTLTGEQILRAVPELEPVAPLVRSAHERFDGTGYPDGLAGQEIPLASRVILCADAFHAIRADRPYRAGRSVEEAVAELRAHSGTQFDPEVAATLVAVVGEARLEAARWGVRRAMGRSPRLMALLLATTIGGTAVAAEPDLRGAVSALVTGHPAKRHTVVVWPRPAGAPVSCARLALEGGRCAPGTVLHAVAVPSPATRRPGVLRAGHPIAGPPGDAVEPGAAAGPAAATVPIAVGPTADAESGATVPIAAGPSATAAPGAAARPEAVPTTPSAPAAATDSPGPSSHDDGADGGGPPAGRGRDRSGGDRIQPAGDGRSGAPGQDSSQAGGRGAGTPDDGPSPGADPSHGPGAGERPGPDRSAAPGARAPGGHSASPDATGVATDPIASEHARGGQSDDPPGGAGGAPGGGDPPGRGGGGSSDRSSAGPAASPPSEEPKSQPPSSAASRPGHGGP